jgi:hypothetical protein
MSKFEMAGLTVSGNVPDYIEPAAAKDSKLFEKLNPPQLYPEVNLGVRFRPGMPVHPADVGGQELTPDEYYLLILSTDAGAQFYARENLPTP